MYAIFDFYSTLKNQFAFKTPHPLIVGSSPCDVGNHYKLHKGGWRGTECFRTLSDSICDRYIFSNTWYKVVGHDDLEPRKMAVGPVDMYKCGTDYPLYLVNGKLSN